MKHNGHSCPTSTLYAGDTLVRRMAYVTRIRPYIRSIRATIEDESIVEQFFRDSIPTDQGHVGLHSPGHVVGGFRLELQAMPDSYKVP